MTQEPIKSEQAPLSGEDTLPSPDSASPVTPLPLAQAIRALPRQYFRAVTKPSVVTFSEEMGKASWNIVWVQLIGLGIITTLLDFLRILISPLHFAVLGTFTLLTVISPIITVPLTFFIAMGIAYGIAKAFGGRGTFLAQSYIALLPYVPFTILGQLLTLLNPFIPPPGSLPLTSPAVTSTLILFIVITLVLAGFGFALLIYRVVVQVLGIMAVHRLTGGKAATVIIVPTAVILIISFFSGLFLTFALGLLH
jgi:hypothetical protein